MNLTAYHAASDNLHQFMQDAQREHRELGTSLRIANEERIRVGEMLEAAIDLLIPYYGSDANAETAVLARVQERAAEREADAEIVEVTYAKAGTV